MARESRRKRRDARYGPVERLADRLFTLPWNLTPWCRGTRAEAEILPKFRAGFLGEIAQSTIVVADNVAEHYHAQDVATRNLIRECPTPCPPWSRMFVEMRAPASAEGVARLGWLLRSWYGEGPTKEAAAILGTHAIDPSVVEAMRSERAAWIIEAMGVAETTDAIILAPGDRWVMVLDAKGKAICQPSIAIFGMTEEEAAAQRAYDQFATAFGPVLMTLSFFNAHGIVKTIVRPQTALNRQRRREGLRPLVTYRTVAFEPGRDLTRIISGDGASGPGQPLQVVPGHFAHYSEDKPLFGHPSLFGTFWIPEHTRGRESLGRVVTDYVVEGPPPKSRGDRGN